MAVAIFEAGTRETRETLALSARKRYAAKLLTAGLLLLSLALLEHGCRIWWPLYADDSFITLRYSKNLVEGHGPVFNPGERVEGYSNPSWMLAMAGVMALGADPVAASKFLGVASAGALLAALFASLCVAGVAPWAAALTTLLVSSCQIVTCWSVSGLETLTYSLLLFLGLALLVPRKVTRGSCVSASFLLCLAALSRPEGIAFWLGGAGFVALFSRSRLTGYLLPGSILLLHLGWRYAYYGALLPNTYYARIGGDAELWRSGLQELGNFLIGFNLIYLGGFVPLHAIWVATAAACGALAAWRLGQGRRVLLMGTVVVAYLAYVVSTGGDNLGIFRYQTPILAPLAYLVGLAFTRPEGRLAELRWARSVAVLLVCGIAAYSMQTLHSADRVRIKTEWAEGNEKLGRYLARTRPPETLIAVAAAGAIPYFSGLPTIDMYGLSDRHIARQAPSARQRFGRSFVGHMKFDPEYVVSRQPDIVVLNRGYFPAGDFYGRSIEKNPFSLIETPLDERLFDLLFWNPDYEFRGLELEDGSRFYVFERVSRPGKGAS